MHICIQFEKSIPVTEYGGIQRRIWWLGKELVRRGHKVTYLVGKGSTCPFADIVEYDPSLPYGPQVPEDVDLVHLNNPPDGSIEKPYLLQMGSNTKQPEYDINTVFLTANHAKRHHATCYVHNGLDPEDYGDPNLNNKDRYIHFLAKAAWKVKNVTGSIKIARKADIPLKVLGGTRLNFKMGFRLTLDTNVSFCGMVGGEEKLNYLRKSKGLLFPVRWNEPFGNAIIESMYFGCPVFATTYGSLPEIVDEQSGFLSNDSDELINAIKNIDSYDPKYIHQRVVDCFTSRQMADGFLKLYEKVLNGETLNKEKPYYEKGSEAKLLPFS